MTNKSFILTAAALLVCLSASAQIDFGLKGGISANWIPKTFVGNAYSVVPQPAFYGGFTGEYELADSFILQGEVIYAGKGHSHNFYTETGEKHGYRAQLHYVQVPAYFGYKIEDVNASVMFGPEFGWLFAAKASELYGSTTLQSMSIKEYCAPFNLALAFQLSYMFTDNLGVDVKFDLGLTRTFNEPYEYRGLIIEDQGHNTSVLFGFCYVFD